MIATREEAVLAALKDPSSVQKLNANGTWLGCSWLDLMPGYEWDGSYWRFTPRPVPPGDLTLEQAKAAHAAGKTVQWYHYSMHWVDQSKDTPPGSYECDSTVGWRLKPEPKLGPEDVPPGSVFRWDCWRTQQGCQFSWATIGYVDALGFTILIGQNSEPVFVTWDRAKKDGGEISTDFGKTWRPCSKEVAS